MFLKIRKKVLHSDIYYYVQFQEMQSCQQFLYFLKRVALYRWKSTLSRTVLLQILMATDYLALDRSFFVVVFMDHGMTFERQAPMRLNRLHSHFTLGGEGDVR